jgi:hypothetical protein
VEEVAATFVEMVVTAMNEVGVVTSGVVVTVVVEVILRIEAEVPIPIALPTEEGEAGTEWGIMLLLILAIVENCDVLIPIRKLHRYRSAR